MSYHDGLRNARAGDTCSASAGWAHRAHPLNDRKVAESLDFREEIGVDLDPPPLKIRHRREPPRKAVRIFVAGHGQALAFLQSLSELATGVAAGVTFLEDAMKLALGQGAALGEGDVLVFPDGTEVELHQTGAWPEGFVVEDEAVIESGNRHMGGSF